MTKRTVVEMAPKYIIGDRSMYSLKKTYTTPKSKPKSKPKKILYRMKVEIPSSMGCYTGEVHPLGFMYLDSAKKMRWWVFGYDNAWYSTRLNRRTMKWDVAWKLTKERDGALVMEEFNFQELVESTEGLASVEGYRVEPSRTMISLSPDNIQDTNFEGSSKAMQKYIGKLMNGYTDILLRGDE